MKPNSPSLKRPSKPARQWLCSSCLRTSVAPPSCLRVDLRKFVSAAVRAGRRGVGSSTQTLVDQNKGRSRLTELVAPQRRWRAQGLRRGKTMGRSNWQADTTDPYTAVGSKGADRQFMSPRKVTATGQKPGLGVANVGRIGCFLPDRLATERPETRRDRRVAAVSTGVQVFAYDLRCWRGLLEDDALAAALFELVPLIREGRFWSGLFLLDEDATSTAAVAARDVADLLRAVAAKVMDTAASLRERSIAAAGLAAKIPDAEHSTPSTAPARPVTTHPPR